MTAKIGQSGQLSPIRSIPRPGRPFYCNTRCILVLLLILVVVTFCVYLPHKVLVAVSLFKVRVYMGNTTNAAAKTLNTTSRTAYKSSMTSSYKPATHVKCRSEHYPRNESIQRCRVPDAQVSWDVDYPDYNPVEYTAPSVLSQPVWADQPLDTFQHNMSLTPAWNKLDNKINRQSHTGPYAVVHFLPRNPVGRTGVTGRGCLGRWGPNHAADPIVTRWKRDPNGHIINNLGTTKPILQFICIQRSDSGEWAIPGGMVEAGERVSLTLKREFSEEAMNSMESTEEQKREIEKNVSDLFQKGSEVYRGYVDDPRNTDNSWMETVAVNFHDETGDSVGNFKLNAGDDAVGVKWMDISKNLKLFASHVEFVREVAALRKCDW